MGYIAELPGVDFFIKSRPLTPKDEVMISAFIKVDKEKYRKKLLRKNI